jgi:hypothetical protein
MTQLALLNKKDYLLHSTANYVAKKAMWLKKKLNSLAVRAKVVINEALYNIQLSIFKLKPNWWVKKKNSCWALTDADILRARKPSKGKASIATAHESLEASWSLFDSLF